MQETGLTARLGLAEKKSQKSQSSQNNGFRVWTRVALGISARVSLSARSGRARAEINGTPI